MCGIAGFIGKGNLADLEHMMAAMVHRGPDDSGTYISELWQLYFGHQRLAIIDLEDGHQPMWDEQKCICVIFNGEIYNHLELRRQLLLAGHKFITSHSDTEVLIHGWKEWGHHLFTKLNGMFAFAIHDTRSAEIILARDRFGEKPLYYAQVGDTFAFASELTALVSHSGLRADPDPNALRKLFAYGYIPAPGSFYKNCYKLPAGSWAIFDLRSRAFTRQSYWKFTIEPNETLLRQDIRELAEEFRGLLDQAVKRRLMSDVPLGLFLSGGLDSSSILASAARVTDAQKLQSFCIGFEDSTFDERIYARQVAHIFEVQHNEKLLTYQQAEGLIPEVLCRLDEPFADASVIPTYLLSAFARKKVRVVLSGDGGDEMLAGYDPFLAMRPGEIYKRYIPRLIDRLIRRLASRLPVSDRNMPLGFKVNRTLTGLMYDQQFWNPVWLAPLEPAQIADLFNEPLDINSLYTEALQLWNETDDSKDMIDRSLEFYTRFYLQDSILYKSDRAAMLNSLESRAVFLDNDLVEFCRRLPNTFKLRGRLRKAILKTSMRNTLPDSIINRPKKGFGIPSSSWLRHLPQNMMNSELGPISHGISKAYRDHLGRKCDNHLFLWACLSANLNLKKHADFPLLNSS